MRPLNRIKKQKTKVPFAMEQFYIYSTGQETNWQFRDRVTQVSISSTSSLEGLKDSIHRFLVRYKDYSAYERTMSKLSEPAITPKGQRARENDYNKLGHTYDHILEDILGNFLKETSDKEAKRRLTPTVFSPEDLHYQETKEIEPQVVEPKRTILKRKKSRL